MEENKKVALYCRYSTHNQDGNFSIDIQTERMQAMCKSKGWKVEEEFIDAAYSGANMDRPALKEMLSRLKEFDVVMVYRLDRLSRSQRDTMTLIQDYFLKSDTAFVSVSETLDTTTPFGMAMIGILAVFAELERATITERMQGGIKKRIEEGYRQLGGDYMPTGYKKGVDNTGRSVLIVDEYEASKVKLIYDLYEETHSISKIQQQLKLDGFERRKFGTIKHILSNRLYIGEVSYKNEYFPGVHEPLVSKDQFERVQVIISKRPKGSNTGKSKESMFSTLITCGCCNEKYSAYSYKVKNNKIGDYYVRSYICNARRYPYQYDDKCMNNVIKNDILEKMFIAALKDKIKAHLNKSNISTHQRTNYELAIKRVDEKIARLMDLYEDGEIDKATLNSRIQKRNQEKENIFNQKSLDAQKQAVQLNFNEMDKYIINFDKIDFAGKRAFIEKVLSGIIIKGDDVIFDWNF